MSVLSLLRLVFAAGTLAVAIPLQAAVAMAPAPRMPIRIWVNRATLPL